MQAISVLTPRPTNQAELPAFVTQRIRRFYDERMSKDWGGSSITRSSRPPQPADLVLQNNDYLSIAAHPEIIGAQLKALGERQGAGPMMSSVFMRENDPMHGLERDLGQSLGYGGGMLTQSGYFANVGLMQAIADERIPVYIDMLAHASLWEGIRCASAKAIPILHNEPEHLRRQVLRNGPGVIVVDAVYSTTGALCPLQDYAAIAAESGSVFVVDESHSLGTHGAHGEGLVASLGLNHRVHFVTASLAKAYTCRAGFVACPAYFREYMNSESFPAIFSSSLLPQELAAIGAAHRVIRTEGWRRTRLQQTTRRVRSALTALGYPVGLGTEQIIAFEIGEERETAHVRNILEANGIFGSVFCAPATTRNRSLIRFTLNAGMVDADIERLLAVCRDKRSELAPETWSASRRLRNRQPGERTLEHVA